MNLDKYKISFGKVAKQYQKYRRTYDERLYELIFSHVPKENVAILDIGCGTGKSTEALVRKGVRVVGIDPDQEMLNEAINSSQEKNLHIEYIKASAEKLPFQSEVFNAAISGAAFHWYASHDSLKEIQRVLKPGGVFVVFWVQYRDSDAPAIGEEIYGKYNWQGIPTQFRGIETVERFLKETDFINIESKEIVFTESKTIDEAVGLLTSNSSYAILSEEDQKNFVQEMTLAHEKAFNGKDHMENEMVLRICYGFKPKE